MSERSRVISIFVVVGLVIGGGGFYFFKIYRPAQDLKNAQAEVTAWEQERWQAARDCLLGKSPASAKTSEALAIREMAPDLWDRGKCTPLVGKISRDANAPDTGIPAIEAAWGELHKAAQKAAFAYADHVTRSTTQLVDPLPPALDALDTARAALRAAAKLPATAATGTALAAVQIVPLADGKDPVTSLEVDSVPSAHGIVLFGKTANRLVQLTLPAGGAPRIDRIGPASLRSVPDPTWGATPTTDRVDAGAFDHEGAIAKATALEVKPQRGAASAGAIVAAVVGTASEGALLYGTPTQLYIAHSTGGAIKAEPPTDMTWALAATDLDGRAAIVYEKPDKKVFAKIVRPTKDEPMTELPPGQVVEVCMTKDRGWAATDEHALAFGGGLVQFRKEVGARTLQGCTGEVAVFRNDDDHLLCADDCRVAQMPAGAPESAATTVVGGKLVAVAAHGGVLGVWREGAQPRFFSMSEPARPVLAHESPAMAITDGKVIDVIARGEKTFVILRIPGA
jgi:hypothetical protein